MKAKVTQRSSGIILAADSSTSGGRRSHAAEDERQGRCGEESCAGSGFPAARNVTCDDKVSGTQMRGRRALGACFSSCDSAQRPDQVEGGDQQAAAVRISVSLEEDGEHVPRRAPLQRSMAKAFARLAQRRDGDCSSSPTKRESAAPAPEECVWSVAERGAGLCRARDGQQQVGKSQLLDALLSVRPFGRSCRKQRPDIRGVVPRGA